MDGIVKLVEVCAVGRILRIPVILIITDLQNHSPTFGTNNQLALLAIFNAFDDEKVVISVTIGGDDIRYFDSDGRGEAKVVATRQNGVFCMADGLWCRGW